MQLIVVDNGSTDRTVAIAQEHADVFFQFGPERSAQRNAGARASDAPLLMFIDSDMVLEPGLVEDVLATMADDRLGAAVIPEAVVGTSFWERCRGLEKRCYLGDASIEAARVFRSEVFFAVGGYDETLTAAEDWALGDAVRRSGETIGRTRIGVLHDEAGIRLWESFCKKRYYGADVRRFVARQPTGAPRRLVRGRLFRRLASEAIRHPILVAGVITLKAVEFSGIAAGMVARRGSKVGQHYGEDRNR